MSNGLTIDISSDLKLELSVAQAVCEVINSPRALTVWMLIQYGEFKQIVDLDIRPSDYQDHSNFADDYLATVILSKSSNLPLGIDKDAAALKVFFDSEQRCGETNRRLLARGPRPEAFERCRRLIRKVLGPLTRADLNFIEENFRFGPGATTGVRGSGSVLSDKYDEDIHLTYGLIPFYRTILGERWWGVKTSPTIVEGNKFTSVPKNAKTNRGICIEPTLNIYGQLGIGACLRKRLRRLGVDLQSQDRNRFLASKACEWNLATIDLSAASDTLSWACVMELLPLDWFEILDLFRSPFSLVEGKYIELEKFSSMGNGFTFELETLIFSSVAFSCVPLHDHHLVSVYGDDIIVPQYAAPRVIEALDYLGFKVNSKKSFLAGKFFESCGTDWFNSHNVRPFYLRQQSGTKIPYTVQIANQLRLYASRICADQFCDSRYKALWKELERLTPSTWRRCRVPPAFGDTGIIVSHDENPNPRLRHGWQGWSVQHITLKPIYRRKTSFGRLLAGLACQVPDISTRGREPKRGYLGKPVPKRSPVFWWPKGLEWCG